MHIWKPFEASRAAGGWSYREHFVGEPIMLTLLGLNVVYLKGALLAEDGF